MGAAMTKGQSMTNAISPAPAAGVSRATAAGSRSRVLAERLEQGARALIEFAETLTEAEWQTALLHDGRTVGVVVHHVATMYPIEIDAAQTVGAGRPVEGFTMTDLHAFNAAHAKEHAAVTKAQAIDLLHRNSAAAADAVRALTDLQLDGAATVSLYQGGPLLTCQFVLEDHAVRHSYHHLAGIRAAVRR